MTDTLLTVEVALPFSWERRGIGGQELATLLQGSRLLLQTASLMEPRPLREAEEERPNERLDTKLDLIIHLLATSLNQDRPVAPSIMLRLTPEGVSWREAVMPPAPGDELVLSLHASAMPIALQMPAHVDGTSDGRVQARFIHLDEGLADAWQQWLFRQHRRAIHAAREGR